ncbi:MAG: helix-turn-helix domain-containing protein [bacterium]
MEEAGFYKTNPKTLGDYIRKTRRDRRMTSKKLAELVGCSKNVLLEWEMDRRIPRLMYLKSLYDVLDVPHKFLRKSIAKSYSLSGKEKNMLFEFDLIQVNLNESMKPLYNQGRKNFQQVGSLLRILRLSLFMTHREFAKILGVDPSTALDWENGRYRPTKNSFVVASSLVIYWKCISASSAF